MTALTVIEPRDPPANMEAEQALLGAILINNDAYNHVAGWLRTEHFSEAAHGRIFAAAAVIINGGGLANCLTLDRFFQADDGLNDVGGASYLARMVSAATTVKNAPHYAKLVVEAATLRDLIYACKGALAEAHDPDPEEPPSAVIDRLEASLFSLHQHSRRGGYQDIGTVARDVLAATAEAMENPGLRGPTTGIRALDDATGGLQPGNVFVLGGRPSMGKTALGLSIALRAAESGAGVGFVSLEMTRQQLVSRALSEAIWTPAASIPYLNIDRGLLDSDLFTDPWLEIQTAKDRFDTLPLHIDDEAGQSLAGIRAAARGLANKFRKAGQKLAVLVVDHLTLVGERAGQNENETVRVGRISNGMRALAKDLDCHVLLLCQLNRGVEGRDDKRPTLADLRHSGDIEQDADVVAFVYREEYYLARSPKDNPDWHAAMAKARNRCEILLQKNRQGPAPINIKVRCDIKSSVFRELN
jgi:replicative DNA helicase